MVSTIFFYYMEYSRKENLYILLEYAFIKIVKVYLMKIIYGLFVVFFQWRNWREDITFIASNWIIVDAITICLG